MKKRMISLLIGAAMITGALAGTAMAEESGKALKIASDICVYTNGNIIVETV